VEVVATLSQGRTAAAQCGLFTYKSVPVIFEPPCMFHLIRHWTNTNKFVTVFQTHSNRVNLVWGRKEAAFVSLLNKDGKTCT